MKNNLSVDCQLSEWGQCNATCGPGKKHRSIEVPAQNGGHHCEELTQTCNEGKCPSGISCTSEANNEI